MCMKNFEDFMDYYLPTIEFNLDDDFPFGKKGDLNIKYGPDFIVFEKNGKEIFIGMNAFSELIRCINAIEPEYIDYVLKNKD